MNKPDTKIHFDGKVPWDFSALDQQALETRLAKLDRDIKDIETDLSNARDRIVWLEGTVKLLSAFFVLLGVWVAWVVMP